MIIIKKGTKNTPQILLTVLIVYILMQGKEEWVLA